MLYGKNVKIISIVSCYLGICTLNKYEIYHDLNSDNFWNRYIDFLL